MPTHDLHYKLNENTKGRDFFLGDLHGMIDALNSALDSVNFDPCADRVISVGDIVDRGPDSFKACTLLTENWFYSVRGNHEEMLLSLEPEDRVFHERNGGEWTLATSMEQLTQMRNLVSMLPFAITLDGPDNTVIGICHAEWPEKDWAKIDKHIAKPSVRNQMLWGRRRIHSGRKQNDKSADLLVHGHTPIEIPLKLGNALYIDTGCVYGGSLTLIESTHALSYK